MKKGGPLQCSALHAWDLLLLPPPLQGLEPLANLKILDVSNNRISKVEGLATLDKVSR